MTLAFNTHDSGNLGAPEGPLLGVWELMKPVRYTACSRAGGT